jgi:NitT/TauT family transport system substrate-binding protein
MRKKGFAALAVFAFVAVLLAGCGKSSGKLIKVQLNEVAHSIFYAPQYAAIELGYFKDEGLDVTLVNGLGADKTMTAVLSGDADIGFMGSEASVYVYNEGKEDYVVNFAQLTQRAGNFLVSRDANENFTWNDVKGKTIIGGRAGGMPEMVFEYILNKNGIDPKKDLTIVQNIDFGLTAQAFAAGTGDYTVEFEPGATSLEKEGTGKVVASLGVESGKVPYTAYSAKKSYIEKHPDVIQKFTNAIQKGLNYVNSHKPEEIAKVIAPQFKETDMDTITKIVTRYYDQNTWKDNTIFEEDSFTLLQDILENAGVLSNRAPYKDLVTTEYAKKAYGK